MKFIDVIESACESAYLSDGYQIVGRRPGFGWGYADAEDAGAVAGMIEPTFRVGSEWPHGAEVVAAFEQAEVEEIDVPHGQCFVIDGERVEISDSGIVTVTVEPHGDAH